MSATETVEEYYEALRRGEPLSPYFAEREDAVKFGVNERLDGYEAIAEGLREQSRTTEDWQVESRDLRVQGPESVERRSVAWFTDDVELSWSATATDADTDGDIDTGNDGDDDDTGTRRSFETRWSGVLEREGSRESRESDDVREDDDADERRWQFVQMHVSAPHEL